ncbi:MAG: beta-ketoacyl-[acyl-carrier-protein] synthase family protein, partial [Verrucomicrobiota bacterium]
REGRRRMSAREEKIVFTGSGIVCGAGASIDEVWSRIESGETAIAPYEKWDGENWPTSLACEVKENNRTLVPDRKLHKSIARTDMFGIYAAEQAIEKSGILAHRDSLDEAQQESFNDRSGLIVGSGGGTYQSNYDYFPLISEADGELPAFGSELGNMVTPMWLLKNLPNNVLCHVGIRGQLKGTNACITNQCASGIMAVAESGCAIRNGEGDRFVAAGHDEPLEPEMVLQYHRLGLMSSEMLRPFDVHRSGTIFGEGAGSLVLEKEGDAKARGAEVIGEYLGFGCCSEATGILDLEPGGDGVTRAIQQALDDAGLSPEEVSLICAHGNGTSASDLTESIGIREVFGERVPPVTGFKWAYGHLIGASGIVDIVMTLAALAHRRVPGVATLSLIDPEIESLPVSSKSRELDGSTALVICRGFGGMNVVVAVRV